MLENKVAIITGATRGIGFATAKLFLENHAKVVILGSKQESVEKALAQLEGTYKDQVLGFYPNLMKEEEVRKVFEETERVFGKIDILVNNAGVQYPQKSLLDISEQQFDITMKTNLYAVFYLTKAVLPYLKEGASIINTSSITTYYGEPELIDYASSKGALIGFTRSLATNLAKKKIRVNAVAPGTFWTPLQPSSWTSDKIPSFGSTSDLKRAGQPYEIASTYVYLASPESSYTTGQVIHVNGGEYKG